MHHTFMQAHTPTNNLWLWPKRPPLAFSVAETSVAEMSGPKRPRPKCPWPKCPTFVSANMHLYTLEKNVLIKMNANNSLVCLLF